jgi:hypothetical protein
VIGASKLNKQDVIKIKKLVAQGLNDSEISRQFIPESGETVTSEHIRAIRRGRRWNDDKNSFIMKEDLNDLPSIKTDVNEMIIETQLGWLKTKTMERWFFLTLIDNQEVDGPSDHMMFEKPSKREILRFHNLFVSQYL